MKNREVVGAVVVATNSGMAFAVARCLRQADVGFQLITAQRYPAVEAMRNCVGIVRDSRGTLTEDSSLIRQLSGMLRQNSKAVVVPAGLDATYALSRIQHELPPSQVFPVSEESLLKRLHDKWSFSALLSDLGIPQPKTFLVNGFSELASIDAPLPAVVKPLDSEGSLGVQFVDSPAHLEAAVQRVAVAGLLPVLVQQHIAGDDMGVSIVADRGRIVAVRVQKPLGSDGLTYPFREDAIDLVLRISAETAFHGVANFDLRLEADTDQLHVLECNPRVFATAHKSAYSGVNFVEIGIRMARNEGLRLSSATPTEVLAPFAVIQRLARTRRRSEISQASWDAFWAELRDPVSSVLRSVEWRYPSAYRRLTRNGMRPWEQFDADRRYVRAGPR